MNSARAFSAQDYKRSSKQESFLTNPLTRTSHGFAMNNQEFDQYTAVNPQMIFNQPLHYEQQQYQQHHQQQYTAHAPIQPSLVAMNGPFSPAPEGGDSRHAFVDPQLAPPHQYQAEMTSTEMGNLEFDFLSELMDPDIDVNANSPNPYAEWMMEGIDNNCNNMTELSAMKPAHLRQSQPIDIQPPQQPAGSTWFQNQPPQQFVTAPASDLNGSIGQAGGSHGNGGLFSNYDFPQQFYTNQQAYQMGHQQSYSVGSANSAAPVQATQDLDSPAQFYFHGNEMLGVEGEPFLDPRFLPNEDINDVFIDDSFPSQSCPDMDHAQFIFNSPAPTERNQSCNEQFLENLIQYPPQTHSNATAASEVGSLNESDIDFFGGRGHSTKPATDQKKTSQDERRERNNKACKKARERRKREKQEQEAKIVSLEEDNVETRKLAEDLHNLVSTIKTYLSRWGISFQNMKSPSFNMDEYRMLMELVQNLEQQ